MSEDDKNDLVHYTVAPKDDMALAQFLIELTELGRKAIKVINADKVIK